MSKVALIRDQSICTRRERRYKVSESMLRCEVALEEGGLRRGTVIDLSATGLRMVCDGRFDASQGFSVELTTDRSHGIYRGTIRRVEPWVAGKSVLGCSLTDRIPDSILQTLSSESIVDRRCDDRVSLYLDATVSWQLHQGNIDAELRDLSSGGMRLFAIREIPKDTRIRVQIELYGEELVLEGRPVWQNQSEAGYDIGVAFTDRDAPAMVSRILGIPEVGVPQEPQTSVSLRRPFAYAACGVIVGYWAYMVS
jgi:hypothetical protein